MSWLRRFGVLLTMTPSAAVLALAACLAGAVRSAAEWPMYRADKQLSCRAQGVGDWVSPRVTWSFDLRGWQLQAAVSARTGRAGTHSVSLTPPAEPEPLDFAERQAWGMGAPLIDLAGDGMFVPAPPYAAKVIPEIPGYQVPDTVMLDSERGYCVLRAYDKGEPREVWRSEEFPIYQAPHPIVVDTDGDGSLEVVACPHYQIVVLDGRTGRTRQQLRWHDGRNYGHFIAKDIDGDGATEFLVLADFYIHMDMVDNDGAELRLLWRKEIESRIENKQKILRPRWDSLQDLDGDGRFEVVTNLYNDTGDRRWHVMVYDALTGKTVLDMPGVFMSGLEDIDGDGRVELFCCEASGLFEPTSAALSIFALEAAPGQSGLARQLQPVTRWSRPSGAWALSPRRYPLHINSVVAHGEDTIALGREADGSAVFYVSDSPASLDEGPRLTQYLLRPVPQGRGGGPISPLTPVQAWSLTGPVGCRKLEVRGHRSRMDGSLSTLVLCDTYSPGDLTFAVSGCRVRPVAWGRVAPERAPLGNLIAADLDGSGQATVLSGAASGQIVAVTPSRSGGAGASLRWHASGAPTLVAADFSGGGRKEVAALGWRLSGEGQAMVLDADGKPLWTAPINGLPGPLEAWNYGTLTTLAAGRLSGAPHHDLIVFARRSTMHSDEGYALSGADGRRLWERDSSFDGQTTWGFGGASTAIVDTNCDGCEDILTLYPVNLTVVSGRDGSQLAGRSAAFGIFKDFWAAYSTPVVWDLDGDGTQELVWNGPYVLGLTDLEGNARWTSPGAYSYPMRIAFRDAWGLVSPLGSELRWLDPASGEVIHTLALPWAPTPTLVAVADINDDGIEEAVIAGGARLAAAQVRDGTPALLWTIELPAAITEFILADTDGDGKLEGVVCGANGVLYGVDGGG